MNATRPPRPTLLEAVGGESGLRCLVEAFYDIIEGDAAAEALHLLHLRGHGVNHSRIEQFNFLCGFLDGSKYYVLKHGHSHLNVMHRHVPIDSRMRDLWLACMDKAFVQVGLPEETASRLRKHFAVAAESVRNLP